MGQREKRESAVTGFPARRASGRNPAGFDKAAGFHLSSFKKKRLERWEDAQPADLRPAAAPAPPAVGDLIERLDLPRASVYRLVDWLLSEGLLAREPVRKRLVISNRLSELACDILRAAVATAPRRTLLEALARETGETCHIGAIDGNRIVYLDRVESAAWPLRLQLTVGSRVPLHATAIGKLFLALSPPRQRRALLAAVELVPLT